MSQLLIFLKFHVKDWRTIHYSKIYLQCN